MHKPSPVAGILILLMLLSNTLIHMSSATSASYTQSEETDVSEWINWAKDAWSYYEPGIGVDPTTGIPKASYRWPYLTDWDLGGYIIAIIEAELMGILPKEGEWGADDRIEKILRFLETRQLSPYGIPYYLYKSTNGQHWREDITNVSDSGRLLIGLAMLKKYRPDLAERIEAIVRRSNYELLANSTKAWRTTAGFYKYYVAQGFKLFGLDKYQPVQTALKEFDNIVKGPHVDVYGVSLPKTEVTSEPLLHMVFELNVDDRYLDYVRRVYEAQERRYRNTGKFTAWTEGNTGLQHVTYVYQWIVTPRGDTWKITPKDITPIIFTKAAFGFHALYNTNYTRKLVDYLIEKNEERKKDPRYCYPPLYCILPPKAFIEGVDENGRLVTELIDKTQVMVIEAAYYALKKKALESADIAFEKSSMNITPGETIQLRFTYLDPTPLRHTCKYNITIVGSTTSYITQRNFDTSCNVTFNWTPPRDDIYHITVKTIANYFLFNNTVTKSFDIKVGTPSLTKEASIIDVSYPVQVNTNEEFDVNITLRYKFGTEPTPLTIIVRDKLTGQTITRANPANVAGEGETSFTATIKAPDREGTLSLILIPAYQEKGDWIELGNATAAIEVLVIGFQQTQGTVTKTVIKKEVTHVTVTQSITVERWITTTHTVTETTTIEHYATATADLAPIVIIICSIALLTIAILALLFSRRKLSQPEYHQHEDVGW
ncbi:MAG: DUF3131 domain-containing protein [Deltaproteobacteria bacterium]|nr:DUF3131 domain-containing protein [Deltaproteobacteria bacterium]